MCLVKCVENPAVCQYADTCISRDVWHKVSEKILQALEFFTLQDKE